MNTNMAGFRRFSKIFASLFFGRKDGFQRFMHSCALDESSPSVGKVKLLQVDLASLTPSCP